MDYVELSRRIEADFPKFLSSARAGHSRRVAQMTAELCAREGIDPERGRAAGLSHDLCKELTLKKQRELAALYPATATCSSLMTEKVMHGPAAAVLLARDYKVSDQGLLEAVALHTLGKPGMAELAILLYCADKLEPGRERIDQDYRRRCLALPPRAMLRAVIEGVMAWMRVKGKAVAPETLILYSSLGSEAPTT
jgi:predicted HD superfamily hydrolase involved in NAD metabolism